MKDRQFFIVLPSDSSMKFFPDNKTTHFITQLPRQINLTGEWAVALTEIQYPQTFMTVAEPENIITFFIHVSGKVYDTFDGIERKDLIDATGIYHLQPGIYNNIEQLVGGLNDIEKLKDHILFTYNPRGCYVKIKRACSCPMGHYLGFANKLRQQLGFEHITPNITTNGCQAPYPASIVRGLPDKLFVYCDLAEPYIVGDVATSLLRIVQTEPKNYLYGGSQIKILSPPNYIPLLSSCFRTIEIDIRDHLGKPIPFGYGTLTLTLHFKRTD